MIESPERALFIDSHGECAMGARKYTIDLAKSVEVIKHNKFEAKFGLVIGRFQPFHNAHLHLIKHALERCEKVVVLVGSYKSARTIRNPFTFEERQMMIMESLDCEDALRVFVCPIRDHLYNDNLWITEVQRAVEEITQGASPILFGHDKDNSSYYLNLFPQWHFSEVGKFEECDSASSVRRSLFECGHDYDGTAWHKCVPTGTKEVILQFSKSDRFADLKKEYNFITEYKAAWASSPFPPMFVTVDSVVIKSGHILVVRRRGVPGKGMIALPGGYLNQNELIVDGALRELKEETGINVAKDVLKESIVAERVFDHPLRSLRGRTITHAFCINLGSGNLPKVKGMDDADKAWWVPLHEVYEREDQFFDDHFHIVSNFVNKF